MNSRPVADAVELPELWRADETRSSRRARLLIAAGLRLSAARRRSIARFVARLAMNLEGGPWQTRSVREFLRDHFRVCVGAQTMGLPLVPGAIPEGVTVGRYCSVSTRASIITQNHPLRRVSTSSVFYEPRAGFVASSMIGANPEMEIGHDVWIGDGATITPGCRRIGTGAVLGAGAVATRDVEPFTVNVGVPARVIRLRHSERAVEALLMSRWWWLSPAELMPLQANLTREIDEAGILEFCRRVGENRTERGQRAVVAP